jgi:predicted negative regulator of RcsB-dependent stress response
MQRLIVLLIVGALGWYGYSKYQSHVLGAGASLSQPQVNESVANPSARTEAPSKTAFRCDGRTYCSQMTSCAEATFFLKNCPDTKMDGNNDGIPCEKQWCK